MTQIDHGIGCCCAFCLVHYQLSTSKEREEAEISHKQQSTHFTDQVISPLNENNSLPGTGTYAIYANFPSTSYKTELYFNTGRQTIKPANPEWTFYAAKTYISSLQPLARAYNYHVCLGGSVLNNEKSEKDLDVYFLPLDNGTKPKPTDLLYTLEKFFANKFKIISKSYLGQSLPYVYKGKIFTVSKRRVDVFVLGDSEDADDVKVFLASARDDEGEVIELGPAHIEHFTKIKQEAPK